ncbi:MAG: PhzF family phenazine biosynthesis protein [Flavitalea sp.]
MTKQVSVINAFSIDGQGGNPAGVVFDADNLGNETKQAIATAVGFPETAFVSSSDVADYRLDFFTPVRQIPHCGHATIATFSYMRKIGKISTDEISNETADGNRTIFFKNDEAFMEQRAPTFIQHTDTDEILAALNLTHYQLIPGMEIQIVNTGNSFMIVPVIDQLTLSEIKYDRTAVSGISEKYGLIGFYLFAPSKGFNATARMFAPLYGIDEEAGTGMAAGPLASYLWNREIVTNKNLIIQQGMFMRAPSPSLIKVELLVSNNTIDKLYVGGRAHVSGQTVVHLPG